MSADRNPPGMQRVIDDSAPRGSARFRVRLIVEIDAIGPIEGAHATDAIARFAAESVIHEAVSLHDAECQVFVVGDDGTLHGPFYRTGAYSAAFEEET